MSTEFNTIPNLLTPNELARFLRISKVSVYRLVNSRKMPFYKIQGVLRFDKKDVLEYLDQNCIRSIN